MKICNRLRKIRKDNNLTQEEFADIINVSRSSIALYEKGIRIPDINTMHIICDHFKISLDTIYEDFASQRNKDRNKFKGLVLTIITALILIIFLMFSHFFNVINRYGYNIYDDNLKVKNCSDICIVKINFLEETSSNERIYSVNSIFDLKRNIINKKYRINKVTFNNFSIDVKCNNYYVVFGKLNVSTIIDIDFQCQINNIDILDKPFIIELKDYNELLSFDNQTGKSKATIDYYLDIING